MFEAFVITLREGVEAALVLGLAITLLRRRGESHRIPTLYAGAGVALVLSVGVAWLATRIAWNEELSEGIAMMAGAVMVFALVWWMWKAAPHMKEEIERGIERASGSRAAGIGLFLFAFGMVLREGAETAIFLSAASLTSEGLGQWIGAFAGLGVAAAFGVMFARGAIRIPLRPFFSVTSAVLVLIGFQLLVGGLHELSEAQVLPASRQEMALIGPIVKNELLLFALTVAVAAGWLLFGPTRAATAGAATSGPEARLERAAAARESSRRRWTAVLAVLVVGCLGFAFATSARMPAREPAQALAAENGEVRIAGAPLADGRMHFFETDFPAGAVRFFAIRAGDRTYTCLDACEICGDIGYFLESGHAVCRNCTSPIPLSSLGRTGGCNPIPVTVREEGGDLFIRAEELERLIPKLKGR